MHRSFGPLDAHIDKRSQDPSTPWLGIGPVTYGDTVVGVSFLGLGRTVALSWRPATDRIHRADVARGIREAAQGQISAYRTGDAEQIEKACRRMVYAQRCAL